MAAEIDTQDEDLTEDISENEEITTTSIPVDDEAFETLVAEIKEVMAELAQDKAMDAVRGEYEKLFNALEKSHKNEKRLNTKCQELVSEIANQQARVDSAEDKSKEDQETIASLKREIEKAWKMVDMTQEREERARETIETLNTEIQNLTKVIEEKTLGAEDTNINELRKLRDELTNQRDTLKAEVEALNATIEEKDASSKNLQSEINKQEMKINTLANDLQSRTNEMNREIRRKERTEREVRQLKTELEEKAKEIGLRLQDMATVKTEVTRLEEELDKQKHQNEAVQRQFEVSESTNHELQAQIENHTVTLQHLEQDVQKRIESLKEKDSAMVQVKSEVAKLQKEKEEWKKKFGGTEKTKVALELDKSKIKDELATVRKEIKDLKRQILVERKKVDGRRQETVALELNLKRVLSGANKQEKELSQALEVVQEKHKHIGVLEQKLEKQKKFISQVEEERDTGFREIQELSKRIDALLDDSRNAESVVFTYRKQQSEMETQLRQQQNLYQAARNDRTILNKSLTGSQDEIADLKSKLRVLQHQFDQLKEEMVAKESSLAKESQEQQKLLKEKEDLQVEMEKEREETRLARDRSLEVEKNHSMMKDRCKTLENELIKCQKNFEHALRERTILNRKLFDRSSSHDTLVRKCSVQDKVLTRGEEKYQERIEDIRVLKLEVKRLRQVEGSLTKSSQSMEEMRKEVLILQKDLMKERMKVSTLQSELDNPLNIHRWRKLEGNDPSTFELIQKIQSLQKKLISKKEELVERDLSLQDKDKVIEDLRTSLHRHPTHDIYDEMRNLKQDLQKRKQDLKALAAENNMLKSQVNQLQQQSKNTANQLHVAKRKCLDLDHKYKRLRSLSVGSKSNLDDVQDKMRPATAYVRTPSWTPRKFAGGGFKTTTSLTTSA